MNECIKPLAVHQGPHCFNSAAAVDNWKTSNDVAAAVEVCFSDVTSLAGDNNFMPHQTFNLTANTAYVVLFNYHWDMPACNVLVLPMAPTLPFTPTFIVDAIGGKRAQKKPSDTRWQSKALDKSTTPSKVTPQKEFRNAAFRWQRAKKEAPGQHLRQVPPEELSP